jgi:D-alanyl-D-alanine dipeptidase
VYNHRVRVSIAALLLAAGADFVDLAKVAPAIKQDLRYATANNFTHQVVYPTARCVLRRPVAERLARVQTRLAARGFGLAVFDCYRPLAVQRKFFSLVPDPRYVADPKRGSRHNRGAAVDVTLVDASGTELDLGTPFDDFTPRAHRNARDLPDEVRRRRAILDAAMAAENFTGMPTEWWHFDASDWRDYPLADIPLESDL